MVDVKRSFERGQLNLVASMGFGAVAGAMLGALASEVLGAPSAWQGAILGLLLGVMLGALVGKSFGRRVISEVPEPLASERSFVGAHSPDDDSSRAPS
jgi:tetrahydromethanopterin S-methyltransferase subunit C